VARRKTRWYRNEVGKDQRGTGQHLLVVFVSGMSGALQLFLGRSNMALPSAPEGTNRPWLPQLASPGPPPTPSAHGPGGLFKLRPRALALS